MTTELTTSVLTTMNNLLPAQMSRRALLDRLDRCIEFLDDSRKVDWEDRERYLMEMQVALVRLTADEHNDHLEKVSYDMLSKMRRPLESQLRDLRSAIVREACKLLCVCVDCLQTQFTKTAAVFLPTMLELVASGNKVIATQIDRCCAHMFQHLRMPMVLPRLISLLKDSKSKDVRESSINYFLICLRSWSTRSFERHIDIIEEVMPYILHDASPTVRSRSRECFLYFRAHFPDRARAILLRADERTMRALEKAMQNQKVSVAVNHPPSPPSRSSSRDGVSIQAEQTSRNRASRTLSRSGSSDKSKFMSSSSNLKGRSSTRAKHSKAVDLQQGHNRPRTAPHRHSIGSYESDFEAESTDEEEGPVRMNYTILKDQAKLETSSSRSVRDRSLQDIISEYAHQPAEPPIATQLSAAHPSSKSDGPDIDSDVSRNVDLPALVAAHRSHLNEVIASVAMELRVLKSYEKIVRSQRQTNAPVDPRPYISALRNHMQEKERQISSLHEDFDRILGKGQI